MSKYGKRTRAVLVTLSSVAILSTVSRNSIAQAETIMQDIQVEQEVKEDKSLVLDPIYDSSETISGFTLYAGQVVQVISEGEVLYSSVIDEEGNFDFEIVPFEADTVITIQIVEKLEEESAEETVLEESIVTVAKEEPSESEEIVTEEPAEEEPAEDIKPEDTDEEDTDEEDIAEEETVEEENVVEEEVLDETVEEVEPTEETVVKKENVKEVQEQPEVTEEAKKEIKVQARMATFSLTKAEERKPLGKSYHYVRANETLKTIAQAYKTTVDQLAKWNDIKNINVITPGQLISVDGYNDYKNINKETRVFNNTNELIAFLAPAAQKAAKEHNIYASIIIAQAIHESAHGKSALATSGNNLFGIKGSYNGNTIHMLTWEENKNGEIIWIVDGFRLYPTFTESLLDNADKIRNGVTWDPAFYRGAWVENTASHMDATEWLTGRYATDSLYASKVNNTISFYNLTQYDTHINIKNPILSQRNINRVANLTGRDYTIFEQPKGAANGNVRSNTNNYLNREVQINKEKVNDLGTWYHISVDGVDLGYVLSGALTEMSNAILSSKPVKYLAIVKGNAAISDKPWGTKGYKKIGQGNTYLGQHVNVLEEVKTDDGTYVLIARNGKTIGWIDKNSIEESKEIISSKDVRYNAKIALPWQINTKPYGTTGAALIPNHTSYLNATVEVSQEKVTPRSTYALISLNGKELGWIDKNALEIITVLSEKNTNYFAIVEKPWSINSQPWGTEGFREVSNGSGYLYKGVTVTKEKTTQRSTYALISIDGVEIGWIDKGALTQGLDVISTKKTNYAANLSTTTPIYSKPWGVTGFKEVGSTGSYLGNTVMIDQEQSTSRNTYARISVNGKPLGWVEKSKLDIMTVSQTNNISYDARVTHAWSINTAPWGTEGFRLVDNGSGYVGKDVKVKQEKVTQRATYALISVNGKDIGWIDKGALSSYNNVNNTRNTHYVAKITNPWSVNTKPWGTLGAKVVLKNATVGQVVEVIQEKTTERSTYALITVDGKEQGWIDVTGIQKHVVQSTKAVNYDAKVTKDWSINTLPWGIEGFALVDGSGSYVGKDVRVVEEKVTERATYALLQMNGKNIGWIDARAIEPYKMVHSEKEIHYVAEITQPWSINSQPWGTLGAVEVVKNAKVGQVVEVISEKVTDRATYSLIKVDGQEIGWLDKRGLDEYRSLSVRDTRYVATVTKPWSINTQPWGTAGATPIKDYASYVGQEFLVTEERMTQKGTYARLETNAGVLGWIDVTGIAAYSVTSTKNVNYNATITKPWSINTQPWGTSQFQPVANSEQYVGKNVKIIQEKTTSRATYGLIQLNGKNIGWIDTGALQR